MLQSTHFLQMQNKRLTELKGALERHYNLLSVFEVEKYKSWCELCEYVSFTHTCQEKLYQVNSDQECKAVCINQIW